MFTFTLSFVIVACCPAGTIRILKSTYPIYYEQGLTILNPGFNNSLNLPNYSTIPALNIKKYTFRCS